MNRETIHIWLPDHIYDKAKDLAREEGISINNFIVSSVSNEVIRQETRDFFNKAAAGYDPQSFAESLAAIPDAPVPESDEMTK
jgi:hypothetical protein